MKKEHEIILEHLRNYLEKNQDLRFGQALFNLQINEKPSAPGLKWQHVLRDNHGDKDSEIIFRIEQQLPQ